MHPNPDSTATNLRHLRVVYRALGDSTRLRIISLLAERGPLTVSDLSIGVALSQPLISWHLRILRLAALIETSRNGRQTICRLRPAAFEELHQAEARLLTSSPSPGVDSSPALKAPPVAIPPVVTLTPATGLPGAGEVPDVN